MAKQLSGHKTRMQVLGRSWKYPRVGQKYCGSENIKKSYLKNFTNYLNYFTDQL